MRACARGGAGGRYKKECQKRKKGGLQQLFAKACIPWAVCVSLARFARLLACSLARFARLLTCSLTTTHSPLTHSPLTHSLPPLPPPSPPRVLRVPPPARATMTSSSRKLRLHRRGFAIVSLAPPALPTTRPMQSAAAHQASEHACAVMKGVVVVVVVCGDEGCGGGGCGGGDGGGGGRGRGGAAASAVAARCGGRGGGGHAAKCTIARPSSRRSGVAFGVPPALPPSGPYPTHELSCNETIIMPSLKFQFAILSMVQFELVEGSMRVLILVGPVHNKLPRLECIQQTIALVPRPVFHSCTVGPRDVLQTNTTESRRQG